VTFGKQGAPVSDCLFNLGLIYKQTRNFDKANQALRECLEIRKTKIGPESVLVARTIEELGTLLLEQGKYVDSFRMLKQCYAIYVKQTGHNQDYERVATLLCFLHRKIEQHLIQIEESKKTGGLELINLGKIVNEIQS
jgi:tetratricopeptide (TPR) repeat protein